MGVINQLGYLGGTVLQGNEAALDVFRSSNFGDVLFGFRILIVDIYVYIYILLYYYIYNISIDIQISSGLKHLFHVNISRICGATRTYCTRRVL
jgi:hypothetical protein